MSDWTGILAKINEELNSWTVRQGKTDDTVAVPALKPCFRPRWKNNAERLANPGAGFIIVSLSVLIYTLSQTKSREKSITPRKIFARLRSRFPQHRDSPSL
jgi:hypothetical protein